MSLLSIKQAVAAFFEVETEDLTQNGVDLFLLEANTAKRNAEMLNDFEFNRRLMTLDVTGTAGVSIDNAVVYGTETPAEIKSVIEVGVFDSNLNLRPVVWTTVAEGLERQRSQSRDVMPRYPTDNNYWGAPAQSAARFEFSGSTIFSWPKVEDASFELGFEVYIRTPDWTAGDLTPSVTVTGTLSPDINDETLLQIGIRDGMPMFYNADYFLYYLEELAGWFISTAPISPAAGNWFKSGATPEFTGVYLPQSGYTGNATVTTNGNSVDDTWTLQGEQYIKFQTIVQLNYHFRRFVPRQEGNFAAPQSLADLGLEALKQWDTGRFETFRRHNR